MSGKSGNDYKASRPLMVFVAGLFSSFILVLGGLYAKSLNDPGQIYTLLATLAAAPPLFVVWMFRNEDKQNDIENTRIETQIKDFHRVEEWATDPTLDETKPALRIAAIHQLRPYLVGDHGATFRRPAYEIYRALLNGWEKLERDTNRNLSKNAITVPLPPYVEAIHTVIREIAQELDIRQVIWGHLLRKLPLLRADLRGAHLEGANLYKAHLEGADLTHAHLEGADLSMARLRGAKLPWAQLEDARLSAAHLEDADLTSANLERVILDGAHLSGAKLLWARLKDASLNGARLGGANLEQAHLEGANLEQARVGENTIFSSTVYSYETKWWDDSFDPEKHNIEHPNSFIHIDEWNRQQEEERKNRPSS